MVQKHRYLREIDCSKLTKSKHQQTLREDAILLNKGSCLAQTLGVIKFKDVRDMIFVTLCCAT
jgi:hypothetical protein